MQVATLKDAEPIKILGLCLYVLSIMYIFVSGCVKKYLTCFHVGDSFARINNSVEESEKYGFFVSGFTLDNYNDFIGRYDHFIVAIIDGAVVGFIMAYSSERIVICEKEKINLHIRDNVAKSEYVLVKQICVSKDHGNKGIGSILYKEMCARVILQNLFCREQRSLYTVIVADPPNIPSTRFHCKIGYKKKADFVSPDGMPRHIYNMPLDRIVEIVGAPQNFPSDLLYDASAMLDENLIGISLCVYDLKTPITDGTFHGHVRVMLKWRKPGIQVKYPKSETAPRTPINVDDGDIRIPKFASNEGTVKITAKYAYLDKTDPPEVITAQIVYEGFFKMQLSLQSFPMDVQELYFRFRIFDSNPDDRCRHFRILPFCDGTPISVVKKNDIIALDGEFQKPSFEVDIDLVAKTSFMKCSFRCVRSTPFYIRTIAAPLLFISICPIAIANIDDYGDKMSNLITLLLTAVAFQFVAKEGLPNTKDGTLLDSIVALSFFCIWAALVSTTILDIYAAPSRESFQISASISSIFVAILAYQILRMQYNYKIEGSRVEAL